MASKQLELVQRMEKKRGLNYAKHLESTKWMTKGF